MAKMIGGRTAARRALSRTGALIAVLACLAAGRSDAAPACLVPVTGAGGSAVEHFVPVPGGALFSSDHGIMLFAEGRVTAVPGGEVVELRDSAAVSGGRLLTDRTSLFLYASGSISRIAVPNSGNTIVRVSSIERIVTVPQGALVGDALAGPILYSKGQATWLPGGDGLRIMDAVPGGVLLASYSTPSKGLFIFSDGHISPVQNSAGLLASHWAQDGDGELIEANTGVYRFAAGRLQLLANPVRRMAAPEFLALPDGAVMSADDELFVFSRGQVTTARMPHPDTMLSAAIVPEGLLIGTFNETLLYSKDTVSLVPDAPGSVQTIIPVPGGALIPSSDGMYLYSHGQVSKLKDTGTPLSQHTVAVPGGVLFSTDRGVFLYAGGSATRIPAPPKTTLLWAFSDHVAAIATNRGLSELVTTPLTNDGMVILTNRDTFENGHPFAQIPFMWRWHNPCAPVAQWMNLHVIATDAEGKTFDVPAENFKPASNDDSTFVTVMSVPTPGTWSFRVVSRTDDGDVALSDTPVDFQPEIFDWAGLLERAAAALAAILVLVNIGFYAAARYSPSAWRIATDDGWDTAPLRIPMIVLRHWALAQLWILDLYVRQARRDRRYQPAPFLPLPLSNRAQAAIDGDQVLRRLKAQRQLWIAGATGMGKTALFRHLVITAFADPKATAYGIYRRDGYILVPIEARRFASADDDKGTSAWVVNSARAVLSQHGLALDDTALLKAMLRTGTVGIAIDGLNEVDRGDAVQAFAADFPQARILVTSQETGEYPFETWQLPRDIAAYVDSLLRLYLGEQNGAVISAHVRDIGLIEHLRSGYDVRLVVELAQSDPAGTAIPSGRIDLYRAVLRAAWPSGDERLNLLQAAAWNLVSERGPNEDKRRLQPGVDLPADLLEAMANVQEHGSQSLRLVRPAPPNYEFVHDQINAFLAASWFVELVGIGAMREQLRDSKIWLERREGQQTLWEFVAALLDNRETVEALWRFAQEDDRRAVLGRALADRAKREGLALTLTGATPS